jgi:hypothetical protein
MTFNLIINHDGLLLDTPMRAILRRHVRQLGFRD